MAEAKLDKMYGLLQMLYRAGSLASLTRRDAFKKDSEYNERASEVLTELNKTPFQDILSDIETLGDPLLEAAYIDARYKIAEFAMTANYPQLIEKIPASDSRLTPEFQKVLSSSITYFEIADEMEKNIKHGCPDSDEPQASSGTIFRLALRDMFDVSNGLNHQLLSKIKREIRENILPKYFEKFPFSQREIDHGTFFDTTPEKS